MTKKEMEKLADMISEKIMLELFGEKNNIHEYFHQEQEIPIASIFPDLTTEELLIGELARLQTILMIYEGQDTEDGYLKAAKMLKKFSIIENKAGQR